jgi:hypothetical protein
MEGGMREDLSEILDKAIAQLGAGESHEELLAAHPQFAPELDPLLQAAVALQSEATTALPVEMEDWVVGNGLRDFTQIAEQMLSPAPAPLSATAPRARRERRSKRSAPTDMSDILDESLGRIFAGESIERCLEAYPQQAGGLEPLLRMGTMLRAEAATPLPAEMAAWLPHGAYDFARIAEQMAPRYARRPSALRQQVSWQRAVVGVAVFVAVMGVADTAAAASLPGQPLYAWKRAKEEITISMTYDPTTLVDLHAQYAKRRISELDMLNISGENVDQQAAEEISESLLHHVDAVADAASQEGGTAVTQIASQLAEESKSALERAAENALSAEVKETFDTASQEVSFIASAIPTPSAALTPTATSTLPATSTAVGAIAIPSGTPRSNNGVADPATTTPSPDAGGSTSVAVSPTSTFGVVPTESTASPVVEVTEGPTATSGTPPTVIFDTPLPATIGPTDEPQLPSPTNTAVVPTKTAPPAGTPLPTNTPVPTATPQPTEPTSAPPPTERPTETERPRPTRTPTDTPEPTATDTPEPTATDTPEPTATDTPEPTATETPEPTATETPEPEPSASPVSNIGPTATVAPTVAPVE